MPCLLAHYEGYKEAYTGRAEGAAPLILVGLSVVVVSSVWGGSCGSGQLSHRCPMVVNLLLLSPFETTSLQGGKFNLGVKFLRFWSLSLGPVTQQS